MRDYKNIDREYIKSMLCGTFRSYENICKHIGYCRSYAWEVLNGVKNGSVEFWIRCFEALELRLKPEEMVIAAVSLADDKACGYYDIHKLDEYIYFDEEEKEIDINE